MKWFKFYGQDWLTDLKVMSISIEDRLCFITLLCLASASDEPGVIKDCCEEDIIRMTHLYNDPYDDNNEHQRAKGCFERLARKGMITNDNDGNVIIVNFLKRQETNLTGYERVKRHREKQKVANNKGIPDNVINDNKMITSEQNRIDKNNIETRKLVSPLKENTKTETPPTFQEWMAENVDEEYIDDQVVYYYQGKARNLRYVEKEYGKLFPTPSQKPKMAPRRRVWVDYDYHLDELKNSSSKVEKIIALIWHKKGYNFDNYDQWRAQMDRDAVYAKKLVGYNGDQLLEAIRRCEDESSKLNYEWGASTVWKKIANVTV